VDIGSDNSEIVLLVFSLKKQVPDALLQTIAEHLPSAGYRNESRKGTLPRNSWFGDLRFAKGADLRDAMEIEGETLITVINKMANDTDAVESFLIVSPRHIWWNAWGRGIGPGSWGTEGNREHDLGKYFCDPQPRRVRVPKG